LAGILAEQFDFEEGQGNGCREKRFWFWVWVFDEKGKEARRGGKRWEVSEKERERER
jgi:hypothetical protein